MLMTRIPRVDVKSAVVLAPLLKPPSLSAEFRKHHEAVRTRSDIEVAMLVDFLALFDGDVQAPLVRLIG